MASHIARSATGLVRLRLALAPRDASLLVASAKTVGRRLYVSLNGNWATLTFEQVQRRLQFVYQQVERVRPGLDVRVLLPCADSSVAPGAAEVDALLGEPGDEDDLPHLNACRTSLGLSSLSFVALSATAPPADAASRLAHLSSATTAPAAVYEDVCVGGTFDYIHIGHKLLLSLAAYTSSKRLVVGVSDKPLLKKKALRELMQPVELRIALVDDFLHSVKPSLVYDIDALQDGYGPAIVDPALSAILVSEETKKGGQMCNDKRAEKGMAPLDVVVMPLVDEGSADSGTCIIEENKASSTHKRRDLLGVLRGGSTHWCRRSERTQPYVVGLTGGIASGKSTARRMLMEIAAEAGQAGSPGEANSGGSSGGSGEGGGESVADVEELDCDQLAHQAYLPGTEAFAQLVAAFGDGIVSTTAGSAGSVDRKALGAIVFANPEAMQTLNSIAWPATARLAQQAIAASRAHVIIMEAAVLLEVRATRGARRRRAFAS